MPLHGRTPLLENAVGGSRQYITSGPISHSQTVADFPGPVNEPPCVTRIGAKSSAGVLCCAPASDPGPPATSSAGLTDNFCDRLGAQLLLAAGGRASTQRRSTRAKNAGAGIRPK